MGADIFTTKCMAIVVTVNCEGVMGAGIAKEAAKLYPTESAYYQNACKAGQMAPGDVFVVAGYNTPKWIVFFATKDSWKNSSRLEWISRGMGSLVDHIRLLNISSIAIPPLGCGHGKLKWEEVKPIIEKAVLPLRNIEVEIYDP
jgi:O-acetyl-ADP-ribose deacetylase (regulator of RNase III)